MRKDRTVRGTSCWSLAEIPYVEESSSLRCCAAASSLLERLEESSGTSRRLAKAARDAFWVKSRGRPIINNGQSLSLSSPPSASTRTTSLSAAAAPLMESAAMVVMVVVVRDDDYDDVVDRALLPVLLRPRISKVEKFRTFVLTCFRVWCKSTHVFYIRHGVQSTY